jgi:hypothetical protein
MEPSGVGPEPGGSWWRQHWREAAPALAALAGLMLLTLAPAGLALGAHDFLQRQERSAAAGAHQPGSAVRDGPASFVVHTVHCGAADGSGARNGQLCVATVEARNDGDSELTIPGTAQRLHGSRGARHVPVADQPKPFGTLRPGEAATATIRFDLPPHSTVTFVEVHATAYTRGQAVAIAGGPLPLLAGQ